MKKDIFIHEKGLCESDSVGSGSRIWAFAHVMKGAIVGRNCNIGEGCFIEAGAVLGDNVTVKNGVAVWDGVVCEDNVFFGPNCTLTNDLNPRAAVKKSREQLLKTYILKGATIGAAATILCGITIGRYAFIGAGAVVIRDVPAYGLVVGNPSCLIGYMSEEGERIDLETMESPAGNRYKYLQPGSGSSINKSGLEPEN